MYQSHVEDSPSSSCQMAVVALQHLTDTEVFAYIKVLRSLTTAHDDKAHSASLAPRELGALSTLVNHPDHVIAACLRLSRNGK